MARADLLSQDEINALLHGVDSGDVGTGSGSGYDGVERPYDFTRQDRLVRSEMPTLELINERFARHFKTCLFKMLRRTTEITTGGVQLMPFSEYLHSLSVPTSMTPIMMNPLHGRALCVIEPGLVSTVVEYFFGGSGRLAKIEGREFSATECRIIQMILAQAFRGLQEAWNPVLTVDLEFVSVDANLSCPDIVSPNDVVVVSSFHVEVNGDGGIFYVVMPYAMLEPIREDLDDAVTHNDHADYDDRLSSVLREEIKLAEVTLSGALDEVNLRLGDLLNLKQGDIIPIDSPEKLTVYVEDVPVCRASHGVHKGSKAIKIQKFIKQRESNGED